MYGDEGILTTFLIAGVFWNLLTYLFPLAVVLWIIWIARRSWTTHTVVQMPPFAPGLIEAQRLLEILANSRGNISFDQRNHFSNAFQTAQNELSHLDSLRRQQWELRLGDMRTEAASMGIFLD